MNSLAPRSGLALVALSLVWFQAAGQSTNSDTWSWTVRGARGCPARRAGVSAVWTGTQMLIWGGQLDGESNAYETNGYRYQVVMDSWSSMSVKNAPTQRCLHTAIWTGRELIIWGGWDVQQNPGPLNTGGRYDPVSDTWRPLSTAGAPQPRLEHTAVWTGKEMLVWGGNNFNDDLNDGGRYDPATDAWKPISTLGAPHARSSLTAVWTGQEMIVWGGNYMTCSGFNCELHYPTEVGRYNPLSNAWKTVSLEGAPTPRADYSAVWDGTEMLVWGGYNGSSYGSRTLLNSGGRFNPAASTWTVMSTQHAPSPRDQHIGLWTGTEMIVWGGTRDANTGGRYRPDIDAWLSITTSSAPAVAYNGEAVWTGEGMLVFDENLFGYCEPGLYAWDGLPDDWQRSYFGPNNPLALPLADPDGDGQNNWMEYWAGTNPTNHSSRLEFAIQPRLGQQSCFSLRFSPWAEGRIYTLLAATNLTGSRFLPLASLYTNAPAQTGYILVTNSMPSKRFFRLEISSP